MTITFKDVGQGDSIVITWVFQNIKYAGIIDCKGHEGNIPTIKHIEQEKIQKIYFIILSHPHIDHYGGMYKLLTYCEEKSIPIMYFIHSSMPTERYLTLYETKLEDVKLLEKIYNKAIELEEEEKIMEIGIAINNYTLDTLKIHDLFTLKILSPSNREIRTYAQKVKLFKQTNELKCSQAANLLSTLIQLDYKNNTFVFTSDSENETLERIYKTKSLEKVNNIIGIQIPHHGSKKNHYPKLWKNINYTPFYTKAIISAGNNKKYNHPHKETVKSFDEMDYLIQATNYINGLSEFKEVQEEMLSTLMALDIESDWLEITDGDIVLPF